jgi:hypothetical protein
VHLRPGVDHREPADDDASYRSYSPQPLFAPAVRNPVEDRG